MATYLDFNATAPLASETLGQLPGLLAEVYGNPSSLHKMGRLSKKYIRQTGEVFLRTLGCTYGNEYKVNWCSGASEAHSWIFHSAALAHKQKGLGPLRVLTSPIEHESVLASLQFLKSKELIEFQFFKMLPNGVVDIGSSDLDQFDFFSLMASNNETGVIQPIKTLSDYCQQSSKALHVDFVQSYIKDQIDLKLTPVTYATFSFHKIGAFKGIGCVLTPNDGNRHLSPLIHGRQQSGLRGGTENLAGILSTYLAIKSQFNDDLSVAWPRQQLQKWKDDFENQVIQSIPQAHIVGQDANRLCNTSYICFENVDANMLLMGLDQEGIYASSGSACSSGTVEPSHVLLAMGYSARQAKQAIRFSAGRTTIWQDYQHVIDALGPLVKKLSGHP